MAKAIPAVRVLVVDDDPASGEGFEAAIEM